MEKEIWVAEFSPSQKAFHVELLENAAETNLKNIIAKNLIGDGGPDYFIFGIFKTQAEAHDACWELRKKLGIIPILARYE